MWAKLGQWLISGLVLPLLQTTIGALVDYIKTQIMLSKLKKDTSEKAKEILNEEDPRVRAKRMRDYFSS